MPRRTLADAKASRIPEAVNLPPADPRFAQYINEAQDSLLKRGHWWGTMARFQIAATAGLITMPREVATIEAVSTNSQILPIHDFWFEWLANGWGPVDESVPDGRPTCEYRGHYPTAFDIVGTNKSLRFVCDLPIDSGKQVLVQGYDDATPPNLIRSQIGATGEFQNGEYEELRTAIQPVTYSGTAFSRITDIIFPDDMQGQCWLYEKDLSVPALTERLIGQYDANNPRPSFARYFFPGIIAVTGGQTVSVEVLAKLEFIPVKVDTDHLMIGNLPALKKACMAIKAEEELRFADASLLMNGGVNPKSNVRIIGAIDELNFELDHYLGTGRRIGMTIQGLNIGTVEEVPNLL